MTDEFMREERYIVFKLSDLGNSLKGDEIRRLAREYAEQRRLKGKNPLECVVVEKDWPEYEPTWRAIAARVTGAEQPSAHAFDGSATIAGLESAVIHISALLDSFRALLVRWFVAEIERLRTDCDALRAKVEAMERQEPVGTLHDDGCFVWSAPRPYESNYAGWKMKLYLAPGAQPAPSVLEGWPTEEMTAAFARVFNVRDQSGTFTPAFRAALAAAPEAKP